MANWIFIIVSFVSVLKMSVSTSFDYYYDYDNYTTNYSSWYPYSKSFVQDYKDAIRNTLPRLFNICPEIRMTLEKSPPDVIHSDFNGTSCCKPCSVAQDCHTTHNYNFCCPQAETALTDVYFTQLAFCMPTVVYTGTDFSEPTEYMYMIVDNCPDYEVNPKNAFDDIVMVHSDGVLYKNKYIAECNGATEYTRWQLLAKGCDFPAIMQNTPRDELFLSVLKNCNVFSVPPKGFDSSHFICYNHINIIDVCNVTGLWDEYDMELEFLCETAISAAHDNEGRVYHNVFCLACNQPSTYLETPQTCERPWSHRLPSYDGIYTILPDNYLQNYTESFCDTFDVLDKYLNKCRPLLCPSRQLPYNGKCLDTTDETSVFQIVLRLSPSDWLNKMFINITKDNHKANNAELLNYFGLLEVCKVQSNYLYTYEMAERGNTADFVIYDLRLNISRTCNESFLSLKLKKTINTFPLQVGQSSLTVTVQMTFPLQYDPSIHALKPITNFNDNSCGTCLIKLLIPLECPYIKLQLIELCYLYKKNNLAHNRISCSDITTNDWFKETAAFGDDIVDGAWSRVIFMCVHQYNNMFTEKSSNEKTKAVSSISHSNMLNVYHAFYVYVAFHVLFLLLNA